MKMSLFNTDTIQIQDLKSLIENDTPPNFEQIVELNILGDTGNKNLIDLEAGENRCSSQK